MTELTICMNVYNGEKYLDRSIGSVRSQTVHDFKLLVYDDGSTDGTVQKLKSFHDDRMKIVEGKENRGIVYARSKMFSMVDTKYMMVLDADDCYCRDDAFERALFLIKSGDYDVVSFNNKKVIQPNGNESVGNYSKDVQLIDDNFLRGVDGYFCHTFQSKIFKTELLKKCIPEKEVYEKYFVIDEPFFLTMMAFYLKRYYMSAEDPIYAYYADIGIYGTKHDDYSLDRTRDLCDYMYNVTVSNYRRMMAIRPLTIEEKKTVLHLCMVDGLCVQIRKSIKDKPADEAVKYIDLWHEFFGKDGMHLLNGVDDYVMPVHIKYLEGIMNGDID